MPSLKSNRYQALYLMTSKVRTNYYLTQCRHYVARNVTNSAHTIEFVIVHALKLAIKINQRTCLIVIDREPFANRILLIIIALNQWFTCLVITPESTGGL